MDFRTDGIADGYAGYCKGDYTMSDEDKDIELGRAFRKATEAGRDGGPGVTKLLLWVVAVGLTIGAILSLLN